MHWSLFAHAAEVKRAPCFSGEHGFFWASACGGQSPPSAVKGTATPTETGRVVLCGGSVAGTQSLSDSGCRRSGAAWGHGLGGSRPTMEGPAGGSSLHLGEGGPGHAMWTQPRLISLVSCPCLWECPRLSGGWGSLPWHVCLHRQARATLTSLESRGSVALSLPPGWGSPEGGTLPSCLDLQ